MGTMRTWRRGTALTLGVIIAMTACSSGSDDTKNLDPRVQRLLPKDTPSVAVTARNGQPAETRQVSGKFFAMYVPANFQEKSVLQSTGEQLVAFDAPSSKPATPVRVAVVPDPLPKAVAIEQSYTLEVVKQQAGVKDLTRSMVTWPGTQSAVLLQWTETIAGAGAADEPLRYWQLMTQVNGQLIVNLIAVAPVSEFDTAGLARIVETFRPHA